MVIYVDPNLRFNTPPTGLAETRWSVTVIPYCRMENLEATGPSLGNEDSTKHILKIRVFYGPRFLAHSRKVGPITPMVHIQNTLSR